MNKDNYNGGGESSNKWFVVGGIVLAVVLLISALVWCFGARNIETPAGYVGYITQGAIFGKAHFVTMQVGPTSSGKHWLYDGTNVSVTPYTYTEEFTGPESVLSKDQLKVSFRLHLIWSVDPSRSQEFVEKYSTLGKGDEANTVATVAYNNFIKERLRTAARAEVQKFNAMEIKDNIDNIGEVLRKAVEEITHNTPFLISSVVVGNIQYPESVSNAVANKLAAAQELETREIQIQIAKKDAERRVADAEGISKAMTIIQTKLTPLYVQHEAVEAQGKMINSPNHTTIYIPVGNNGVPLVGTLNVGGETK